MFETVQINGHSLAYSEHNPIADNTPIVYLHGILNTIHIQETVLNDILQGQHWIALSLPGHYPAQFSDDLQAEDLTAEFIGHILSKAIRKICNGKPVRLIGHSTGGFSSLAIAYIAPELVESICVLDGFAQGHWHSIGLRPLQIMANLPLIHYPLFTGYMTFAQGNRFLTQLLIYLISHDHATVRKDPAYSETIDFAVEESGKHVTRNLYHYFRNMPATDIRAWLPEINIPVTIIHGENDPVILPEHAREMQDLLPNSTLNWLPACGHDPFSEATESLKKLIREWNANTNRPQLSV